MNPDQIIERSLAHLHGVAETATVELLITQKHSYVIALTPLGAFLEEEPLTEPTLRATLSFDTFLRIADGSYSLLQAYLDSQLQLKGDLQLAERIAAKLTSPLTPAMAFNSPSEQGLQELARILGQDKQSSPEPQQTEAHRRLQ